MEACKADNHFSATLTRGHLPAAPAGIGPLGTALCQIYPQVGMSGMPSSSPARLSWRCRQTCWGVDGTIVINAPEYVLLDRARMYSARTLASRLAWLLLSWHTPVSETALTQTCLTGSPSKQQMQASTTHVCSVLAEYHGTIQCML